MSATQIIPLIILIILFISSPVESTYCMLKTGVLPNLMFRKIRLLNTSILIFNVIKYTKK